jgi:hypothetical protein
MNQANAPRIKGERGARRAKRKKRLLIGAGIVLLLLVLGVFARPVYRGLKARRANQFAAAAEELIREGKLNDAASKYRAALQLDPLGYRPLSGAARLASRGGRPEALGLWQEVIRLPQCTASDRQEYVTLLLQQGRMSAAEKIVEDLLRMAPDVKTMRLAAEYAKRTGDEAKALEYARLAAARAPEDGAMRFMLAEMLARSSDPAQRAEAREILWVLARQEGAWRKGAIEALARAPELSSEEEQRVLAALNDMAEPGVISSLLAAGLRLKLQPEAAEQIYQESVSKWATASPADLAELTRWLNLHNQSERVLTLLPVERAVASEPLLLSRLDALANLGRWGEIDALLARPDLSLDPTVAESFRARSAMGRGAALDAELYWDRAIALGEGDPAKLRFLANFAEQSRATATALKSYDQLARFPEHAAFAHRGRQRLIEQTGDAVAARGVAERLSTVAPDDVNAQAQLIHLDLLLEIDVEANLGKAKALMAKFPTRLSFRVTTALGYLRQHDAASALAQFQGPAPIEWPRTPPGWRAVYAAALAANEENEAAREIIATIPLERLNKEERALVASASAAE